MNEREQIIWGIHAGRLGEADNLFLKKKVIAIGWHELGDISSSGRDRETLKNKIAATYPKAKAGAIPVHAGQLYRFITERLPVEVFCCASPRNHPLRLRLRPRHFV